MKTFIDNAGRTVCIFESFKGCGRYPLIGFRYCCELGCWEHVSYTAEHKFYAGETEDKPTCSDLAAADTDADKAHLKDIEDRYKWEDVAPAEEVL